MRTYLVDVHFNRLEYSKLHIYSILNNMNTPCKMTVFDNASGDGTSEFLKKVNFGKSSIDVDVIVNNENQMWITKLNELWKKEINNFEFFGFIHCDDYIERDWVEKFESYFDIFPEVGVIWGKFYEFEVDMFLQYHG